MELRVTITHRGAADNRHMTRTSAHLLRIFVAGLLAALPLAATLAVLWWVLSLLNQWLGPHSAIGQVLMGVGLGVTGSELVGYLIGIGLVLLVIFMLGLAVEVGLERGMASVVDAVLTRIPLVRSVYDLSNRLVDLFAQREGDGMKSMGAVWCHFGGVPTADGPQRAAVLALLSTPEPVLIGGLPYLGVIVPTAPVPVGGALLYLPQAWVTPADIGIDALTSIYVSMGLTSAQHMTPPAV
jgi:uncharacterized membrane protein